jgi:hypothetical protein
MDSGVVLLFGALLGVAVFLAGIVWGNSILFRMQKALNEQFEPEQSISPWKVMGRAGGRHGRYRVFERYKDRFGDTSLVHQDRFSARLIFCGAIIGFGSLFILKVRN